MLAASDRGGVLALGVSEATRDEELGCAAQALLRSSPDGPVRTLRCEARQGVVTVSGVVPSFYLKRMAQVLLLRLHGLQGVRNLVEVGEMA